MDGNTSQGLAGDVRRGLPWFQWSVFIESVRVVSLVKARKSKMVCGLLSKAKPFMSVGNSRT